jgi:glutamate carboxypeptidase
MQTFSQVSDELGFGPAAGADPRSAGRACLSFTPPCLLGMSVDGVGPGREKERAGDERSDLPTLALHAKLAAVLMHRSATRPAAQ